MRSLNEQSMKLMFSGVGILLLIQLIYFYNSYFGWFHLPLFVFYMMIVDIYKKEHRKYKIEILTLFLFSILSLSLIFFDKTNRIHIFLINVDVLALLVMCSILIYKTFILFKTKDLNTFINNRNSRLIEKKTRFMPVFLACTELSLVFAATKILFRILI